MHGLGRISNLCQQPRRLLWFSTMKLSALSPHECKLEASPRRRPSLSIAITWRTLAISCLLLLLYYSRSNSRTMQPTSAPSDARYRRSTNDETVSTDVQPVPLRFTLLYRLSLHIAADVKVVHQ